MTIRKKISISIVLVGFCILVSYAGFLLLQTQRNKLLQRSYLAQLEASVRTALTVNNQNLINLVNDYSTWDEMVTFTENPDPAWSKSNLSNVLGIHDVSALWVYDLSLKLVYSSGSPPSGEFPFLSEKEFFSMIKSRVENFFFDQSRGHFYQFAASSIHSTADTLKAGVPAGYLVICRILDLKALANLAELSGADITIHPGKNIPKHPEKSHEIFTRIYLHTWNGEFTGTMKFIRKQPLLASFLTITQITSLFYLAVAFSLLIFFSAVLFRWILDPLKRITSSLALEDASMIRTLAGKEDEYGLVSRMIERFLYQKRELAAIIHEKNEILKDLQESESSNRAILNAIPDYLVRINTDGIITNDPSGNFNQLLLKSDRPTGKHFSEALVTTAAGPLDKAIQELWKSRLIQHFTFPAGNPAQRQYFEATVSLTDAGDYLLVLRDITSRKEAELTLHRLLEKEAELNRLKTQFITTVSHEFRTPLSAISTNVQLLEMYDEKWPVSKKQGIYGRINQAVRQMTVLLEDVSLIGRHESGKATINPSFFNLRDYLVELLEQARDSVHSETLFEINDTSGISMVMMDRELIRYIFLNLFSNAFKFSPIGKKVTLTISHFGEKQVKLVVRDEGIGIPLNELLKVFEPFHRAENARPFPGTGLGMSIVKRCVETHKGTITIESEKGHGTSVTVIIPDFLNKQIQL